MGSKTSKVESNFIDEFSNINEEELDISNIDKKQIRAIKEMSVRIKELENKKKSDRIMYKLPAIQLCSWSLI